MVLGDDLSRSASTAQDGQIEEQPAPALDNRVGFHTQEDLATQPISSAELS